MVERTRDATYERSPHLVFVAKAGGIKDCADLAASETFLRENGEQAVRPMARPVRFEWDDHDWSGKPHPHERPKEARTNPQVASVESA